MNQTTKNSLDRRRGEDSTVISSQTEFLPSVSIIVPTYKEACNLPELIDRLESVRNSHHLDLELLLMDDNSQDGTEELVVQAGKEWVHLIVRRANRGLSAAVIDGFSFAKKEIYLVMDADLSHPPEKIPEMLVHIAKGADFVVGSRYVTGGTTEESWGWLRWLNSKVATLLARPLISLKDPMSGFFAFPRRLLATNPPLNPVGYKIGLELLVKCNCQKVIEIPIHFSQRVRGQSKLSFKEQLLYLEHLRRLADYRYGEWARLVQFGIIGFSGTLVNLFVLTFFLWLSVPVSASVALAILISMLSNFLLHRKFTFSHAYHNNWLWQLAGFVGASSIGTCINYAITLIVIDVWPLAERFPQVAAIMGILSGMLFNYIMNRYLVFRNPCTRGK